MIQRDSVIEIGVFNKPHGINGELSATVDFDLDFTALKCIVVEMDGILVPFFISSERPKSASSVLLKIDGIDNERDAMKLARHAIFALKEDVDIETPEGEEGFYADDLIGYTVTDNRFGQIGRIIDLNTATDNVLFIVERPDGSELFIPVAMEMILDVDADGKILSMDLPEGLLEL